MTERDGRRVTWRHRLAYVSLRAVVGGVALMPERIAYAIAGAVGRGFFRVSRTRRRLALRFLRQAFGPDVPERALMQIAARSTGNLFKVGLDAVRLPPLADRGRLLERVDVRDARARFPAAPFLAVTAHLGCWEAGVLTLSALGFEVHAVVKSARNPLIDRWMVDNRRRAGVFIHPRRGGIRTLARVLASGGVSAMVVDQNQRLRPVIAPFFGAPARCERSAAKLALRHGCPVVVAGVVRVGSGMRFRVVVTEPLILKRTGDPQRDLVAATTQINHRLEEMIRQAPDQYLWIHDRYRGAPAAAVVADAGAAASITSTVSDAAPVGGESVSS